MISPFGVEHGYSGSVSKLYTERREATSGEMSRQGYKRQGPPGKLKRMLMPKRAERQAKRAQQPVYAYKTDEWTSGQEPMLHQGDFGQAKTVRRFSSTVRGES